MKEIALSQHGKTRNLKLVALVDDEDFESLNQFNWCATKRGKTFYAIRACGGTTMKMHRQILKLADPKILTDHIDHNGLNNQKENLRLANYSQSNSNRNSNSSGTSKYLGVSWDKRNNRWTAQIQKGGVRKHLGGFRTETEAAICYNEAAKEVHGEFANINLL